MATANVFDRLGLMRSTEWPPPDELEFISVHFHEFSFDALWVVGRGEMCVVLCSQYLRLESEDSLFNFVKKSCESRIACFEYFEPVGFEFLPASILTSFGEFMLECGLTPVLISSIWPLVSLRLMRAAGASISSDRCVQEREFRLE
jgi:hypothetical protein